MLPTVRQRTSEEVRAHALNLESARRRIPHNTYLAALHHAICTGIFPEIDPNTGKIDVNSDQGHLTTDQRVESVKYMLSLALPQLKRVAPAEPDNTLDAVKETVNDNPGDIRALTTDQLKQLVKDLTPQLSATPEPAENGTGPT